MDEKSSTRVLIRRCRTGTVPVRYRYGTGTVLYRYGADIPHRVQLGCRRYRTGTRGEADTRDPEPRAAQYPERGVARPRIVVDRFRFERL